MHLLSPIIDGFLNDNHSPEELAETHSITVREVLDLLLSVDAINILRRLAQAERLRQTVLSARARSKALATLDYLTHFDRHAKHSDCDLRRRVSEAILKQTRPDEANQKPPQQRAPNTDRRASTVPRAPHQVPDLVRLRAARVAAEQACEAQPESLDHACNSPSASSSINLSNPSPLFSSPLRRREHPSSLHPQLSKSAASAPSCMNSASCSSAAQPRAPCRCRAPCSSP